LWGDLTAGVACIIVNNKIIYPKVYTSTPGKCVQKDGRPTNSVESDENKSSEEACEDACFARSDCTAVSFNPGSFCTLILWTGEILSNGAGSFTCKLRNPYYKSPPSINYEDKIGKCVNKAS
jgi:hypothetical protein